MIRILDISDIHPRVNGSYAGKLILDPTTGYSLAFEDIRKSLKACLDWEAENPCDLAVIPGDVFDVPRPSPAEYALISEFLLSLLDRMSIVVIAGNHDIDANTTAATALEPLKYLARAYRKSKAPHELHVFTQPDRVLLQTAKGPVCVSALPYPSKGRFQAAENSGDAPEVVLSKMNQALKTLCLGMSAGLHATAINVMLAHGTTSGATVGEQPRSIAHDLMIPVDAMDQYDAVCLGHVHKHQMVADNAFYAGSVVCSSFGEKDEKKGWCVVEAEKGQKPIVTHILNPRSRLFMDIPYDRLKAGDVDALGDGVYRIVGEVPEFEYPEAALAVAKFESAFELTQNNLDVTKPDDRVRDASITTLLSADAAVEKVVRTLVPEESVSAVMALHHQIQEVRP